MVKKIKLRKFIESYLREHGKAHTGELLHAWNEHSTWGATVNEISNVLGKFPGVEICGVEYVHHILNSNRQNVWRLKEENP